MTVEKIPNWALGALSSIGHSLVYITSMVIFGRNPKLLPKLSTHTLPLLSFRFPGALGTLSGPGNRRPGDDPAFRGDHEGGTFSLALVLTCAIEKEKVESRK